MDIDYLLWLQNLRQYTESFLAPIMDFVTKCAVGFIPLALVVMLYWAFDRKAGRRILAGMSLAYLMNGFLKLTCCVYRPWIRDSRIIPYGDAKTAATGYSFPSGHTTSATAKYGSVGWWSRKRNKILAGILFVLIALTMFSRNYLGVHTPQDVLVGFGATVLMLVVGNFIEKWSDKDPQKRDKIILVAGLTICVACFLYYNFKSYPMDYLADGSLLVDPKTMLPDSFEGLGFVSGFAICRMFERNGFDFEKEMNWKNRFIIGTICLIPLCIWDQNIIGIITMVADKCAGKFIWSFGIIFYTMILVPWIMKKVNEKGILK